MYVVPAFKAAEGVIVADWMAALQTMEAGRPLPDES